MPRSCSSRATPGAAGYPDGIGYRGNDGTDYWGLDQAFPISGNGLLFDVGTNKAEWGMHPLFAIWSEGNGYGAAFTGGVKGVEYYNIQGASSAVASAWRRAGALDLGNVRPRLRCSRPGGLEEEPDEPAGCSRLETETRPAALTVGVASRRDAASDEVRSGKRDTVTWRRAKKPNHPVPIDCLAVPMHGALPLAGFLR